MSAFPSVKVTPLTSYKGLILNRCLRTKTGKPYPVSLLAYLKETCSTGRLSRKEPTQLSLLNTLRIRKLATVSVFIMLISRP